MNITPDAQDLWEGIAGHFDSISQVLSEFVDNSISNLSANKSPNRTVQIELNESGNDTVRVRIEDNGTGVKNLEASLRLGDRSAKETPLNEHGFGLKHALASSNPENDNWRILTRTEEDFKAGIYRELTAPYKFDIEPIQTNDTENNRWPGNFNGSGTIVEFTCSRSFFDTIQAQIRGRAQFVRCLDYLVEELGYIYSGVIKNGEVTIIVSSANNNFNQTVPAALPQWAGFYEPGQGETKIDLGGGEVVVEFSFGEMRESELKRHYKRNLSTSGVEIRTNGRLLMDNLFKEIWDIEAHPTFNHFLVQVNLISDSTEALPKTRTSKNGVRIGDEKLEKLYEWIRSAHPKPVSELSGAVSERELVSQLAELKGKHIRKADKQIRTDLEVFSRIGSPVKVDLYVFDGDDIVLYEAKKDYADAQSVYQLLMYWDGCVSDNLHPSEGIILSSTFSPGIDEILDYFNSRQDANGTTYKFSKKTWQDEGIKYPKE